MSKKNKILNWSFLIGIWAIPFVLLGIIPTSEIPVLLVFFNMFASIVLLHDWFLGGVTNTWKGILSCIALALFIYAGFVVALGVAGTKDFGVDEWVALHSNRYMVLVFLMLYTAIFTIPRIILAKVLGIKLSTWPD